MKRVRLAPRRLLLLPTRTTEAARAAISRLLLQGWSRRRLARTCCVTRQTLQRLERGQVEAVHVATLARLRALECTTTPAAGACPCGLTTTTAAGDGAGPRTWTAAGPPKER